MSIRARERLLNFLIVLGVIALIFVVGYPQYKESLPSEIRIGIDRSLGSVPFYIAQTDSTRNYFAIAKVKPVFVEIDGDPLQGIKDGKYDIAAVPWYWLIVSPTTDGDTVRALSAVEIKSGRVLDAILIPVDSRIKAIKDLKGKRMGYNKADEYLVNLIFSKLEEDKTITQLIKVALRPEEIANAFTDNKVDALYLIDPYRGYMVNQGNKILFEGLISSYVVSSLPYAAIVMRNNFVKNEKRLAAIRTKDAVEATISYLARNPEIGKNYVIRVNEWPHDGALSMSIRMPEYQRLAEINLKDVENLQTFLVQRGISTCGIKPVEFLFTKTDFVR
jgi:ABC-type nitrate/sulfonate/bicarbonate transport system substrate-binding protein